jgi:predicted nucleic acid-binding protein
MIFLLDTNAFSDLMRKRAKIEERLSSLDPLDSVVTCTIVRGEILYGIRKLPKGHRRDELLKQAAPLFAALCCEAVPESAADHYANVKIAREREGLVLDENDLWIAATALGLGAALVTRDKDFQRIDGLLVENWEE